MATGEVRALLITAALVTALTVANAARFGDRLRPRVPTAYAPRTAPSSHNLTESDYDDTYGQDYDEKTQYFEEEKLLKTEQPPRRAARTEAHRLELSTEYFVIPKRNSPISVSSTAPTTRTSPKISNTTLILKTTVSTVGALRAESWAVPILAISCATMVILAGFEVFIVWGATRKAPSHRHLLLGQTLLFGLFSCAATAALFATTPTAFTCGAVRFGTGVAYVIVFASLLVKCVFLLSLNGGVYLPAAYQGLLLFFAVMIQVAIGAQWLGGSPPKIFSSGERCDSQLSDLLMSLCYTGFLIAVVCGVALRSRGIHDNYREATHIAGASGATAAVWVCWIAAALGASERHRDACVAAGLLGTCAVVFALMFAPKGRRLAALGREGRWDADREERLSSLGAGGSGYSPSFFHFKPVKYGMVSPTAAAPAAPPLPDRKETLAQPADPYGAMFGSSHHLHSRVMYPPRHYPPHPFMHYHYPPYPYLPPPGMMLRPDDSNVYTSVEPTFSSNPNVFFQRTEPLHVGMMY